MQIVFLVVLIIASCIGCEKKNQPPTCQIVNPSDGAEFKQGEIVTISVDADDPDGNITEVRFYIDHTGAGASSSFPYHYDWNTASEKHGIKIIKATAEDDDGDFTSDEISINLVPGDPPDADFTANKTNITIGETIQFTDQSTNDPTDWYWDFGDGAASDFQNPSHTYPTAGSYNVTLSVSNRYGQDTETKTGYITVNEYVTDYDGNIYPIVIIGNQTWMERNLKVRHYADGTPIPLVQSESDWIQLKSSDKAYCWYDNSRPNRDIYGGLYTWAAAMNGAASSDANPSGVQGVCPDGWHLPSDAEWTELINYLGGEHAAGGKMKEAGSAHWYSPNEGATNSSGFTALPGGKREYDGAFRSVGVDAQFWTATEMAENHAWYRALFWDSESVYRDNLYIRGMGFSVRCVRD